MNTKILTPIQAERTRTQAGPAFVPIPGRGGDSICSLSKSSWLRLEADGLIKLTRITRPGKRRCKLLLPVAEAIAVVERLNATRRRNAPDSATHTSPAGNATAGKGTVEEREPRDHQLSALANVGEGPRPKWGQAGSALETIEALSPGVTSSEIGRRAATFKQRFPGTKLSPMALAEAWGECAEPVVVCSSKGGAS